MKILSLVLLWTLLFCPSAFAWNAMGHRVIAVIAYDHLTPATKQKIQPLIEYLADAYPYSSSWQMANVWADQLRYDDVHTFDSWHFYDKPFFDNKEANPTIVISPPNSVWAVNQAVHILKSPHSRQLEKALFLRFLLHLTEDIHQPFHDITLINAQFPQNDKGGNLYLLKSSPYLNLHAAWDAGLGFFNQHCTMTWSKSQKAICLAKTIQQEYPVSYFRNKINNMDPQQWADEGYQIAVQYYQTPQNQPLSAAYILQGQKIVEQQLALAGYRLAYLLNLLYG